MPKPAGVNVLGRIIERAALVVAGLVFASAAACEEASTYVWEASGAPVPTAQNVWMQPPAPAADGPANRLPANSKSPFLRCLQGLEPEQDPLRDLIRLTTVCGPSTGMTSVLEHPLEGALNESAEPLKVDLALKSGHCYRIFAIAADTITELDIEVRSSRGTVVAQDHATGRVAILQPDRPFCSSAKEDATLSISARAGSGAFALDVLEVRDAAQESAH